MEEDVAAMIQLEQIGLREKAGKMHFVFDVQLPGERLQRWLKRAFASDKQLRARMLLVEKSEGAKASGQPFFRNQAAGLQKSPVAMARHFAANQRKLRERNPGAIDPDALGRTTETNQAFLQRTRARQHERN